MQPPDRYRVAHLTSAHPRYDTRIFLKQCRSLASAGYEVFLVVADGLGDEVREGVFIVDVGKPKNRLDRMGLAARRVLAKARELKAALYHLHDPELLPAGLALKRGGGCVIFDAHEDLPRQLLSKPYLHPATRRIISVSAAWFERYACRKLDHVVAATPAIRDKFVSLQVESTNINNYPLVHELEAQVSWDQKRSQVCYIGGIASIRGIRELVRAMDLCTSGVRLELVGKFGERGLREDVAGEPGWKCVDERGFLDREGVRSVLGRSLAGIVTFLPEPNHIESQPNKMFEYMSAGLPVIGSNFPLWRQIIEGNDCGLCVDPSDPLAIARAIDFLVENPDVARTMGSNGRRAVLTRYNWGSEETKLLALYGRLAGDTASNRPHPESHPVQAGPI